MMLLVVVRILRHLRKVLVVLLVCAVELLISLHGQSVVPVACMVDVRDVG